MLPPCSSAKPHPKDPILTKYLPRRPSITYMKSKTIGNRLVSSRFLEKTKNDPCRKTGTFPCRAGDCCAFFKCRTTATLKGGIKWKSRHFVDCETVGIVYFLQFPCGTYYMGKTRRPFKRRIYDHYYVGRILPRDSSKVP